MNLTPQSVCEALLVAPPALAEQIYDFSLQNPSWLRDVPRILNFPTGNGAQMQQLIYRGARPPIERDFSKWKKVNNLQGCNPCDGPDCSYNMTTFGGYGLDRKIFELMSRDFRSPNYCVREIQTTAHFRELFAKTVENLYLQTSFFKEINVNQTTLVNLAKKYVIDSDGPKPNPQNPYNYRNVGTARLGTAGIELFEFFYEWMNRIPSAIPYDIIDGAPIYSVMIGRQMLSRIYRDDANLRQDVRFSGLANDLLMKYNFMSTLRGMFIAAPIMWPRRFRIVDGVPEEVLPTVNEVPAEFGCYTDFNPLYEDSTYATHEEAIIHGRYPFDLYVMEDEESLGGNTSFGPSFSYMNNWSWVNPQTEQDPARRNGYFFTSATIAIAPQFSEGIFAVLLERVSAKLTAVFTPQAACPPEPVVCDNVVPDVACPCPVLASDPTPNAFVSGNYIFNFLTPLDAVADDELVLQLDNGATVTGTVVQITDDGLIVELAPLEDESFTAAVCAASVVGVSCDDWASCGATVLSATECAAGELALVLSNAIKAVATDVITAYFADCSTQDVTINSIDATTNTYTVQGVADVSLCVNGGISHVCVPPDVDDTCPACEITFTACTAGGSGSGS